MERPRRTTAPTILLVDDDPDARLLIGVLLEAHLGARVVAVEGIDEALRALAASPADVVVSDGRLQGEDARDLARRVVPLGVPVVVVTAADDAAFAQELLALGVRCVLAKPPDPGALAAAVREAAAG